MPSSRSARRPGSASPASTTTSPPATGRRGSRPTSFPGTARCSFACPDARSRISRARLTPRGLGEVELDDRLTRLSKDYALDHPTHVISAGFWNGLRFLDLENPVGTGRGEAFFTGQPQSLAQLSIYCILARCCDRDRGLLHRRGAPNPLFIWLIPPLIMLSVMFVVATSRYRAPIEPIIVHPRVVRGYGALARLARQRTPG